MMENPVREKRIILEAGESQKVEFNVPLYYHGVNILRVDTLTTNVEVTRPDFRKRYYSREYNKYDEDTKRTKQ